MSEFRKMAEHRDLVEKIIEESTEKDPPSRRKILAAIKAKEQEAAGAAPAPAQVTPGRPNLELVLGDADDTVEETGDDVQVEVRVTGLVPTRALWPLEQSDFTGDLVDDGPLIVQVLETMFRSGTVTSGKFRLRTVD